MAVVVIEFVYSLLSYSRMSWKIELMFMGAGVIYYWGAWLITTKEVGRLDTIRSKLPALVRVAIFISILFAVFESLSGRNIQSIGLWFGLAVVMVLVNLFGFLVFFMFLGLMAGRLPDPVLMKRIRNLVSAYVIFYAVSIGAIVYFYYLAHNMLHDSHYPFYMILWYGVQFLFLALVFWTVFVLNRYRRALKRASICSRETWANEIGLRNVYRGGHRLRRQAR